MLALRGQGLSFSAIAGRLNLRRSKDAYQAYHRALHGRPEVERPELIRQELERLSTLEARIRSRDAADPAKMAHRLEALEEMRKRLGAA